MRISLMITALMLGCVAWYVASAQTGLKFVDASPSAPEEMASAAGSR